MQPSEPFGISLTISLFLSHATASRTLHLRPQRNQVISGPATCSAVAQLQTFPGLFSRLLSLLHLHAPPQPSALRFLQEAFAGAPSLGWLSWDVSPQHLVLPMPVFVMTSYLSVCPP